MLNPFISETINFYNYFMTDKIIKYCIFQFLTINKFKIYIFYLFIQNLILLLPKF